MITSYILYELSYDRFHENSDRIYRVALNAQFAGQTQNANVSNAPTAPALIKDYPEVNNAVRFYGIPKIPVRYEDKQFYEENVFNADNSVFEVFTYPFIAGDPKTALLRPYTVVITEETARKYFGDENPIGKMLKYNNEDNYTVTGIMKNIPKNSHMDFDMLFSFETLYSKDRKGMERWIPFNYVTYVLLQANYDYNELNAKFPEFMLRHMGDLLKALGGEGSYFLQPLTSIHLHSHLEYDTKNSDIAYIFIFGAVALFILLIACINFMNLSTARSSLRAKEVGMRKVLGSGRRELIWQFLGESIIYSLFSLIIAFILAKLVLPLFSSLSGTTLTLNFTEMPLLIPGFIMLALFIGVVSGSYPAFYLSAFPSAKVLKGSLRYGITNSRFRSILVIVQFTISIVLIVGTWIIMNQLSYMKNKRLGFDKEKIVVIPIKDNNIRQSLTSIKEELKSNTGVVSAGSSSRVPGQVFGANTCLPEGFSEEQTLMVRVMDIDDDFFPTLGMEIVAGRNFSKEITSDEKQSVIMNEALVKKIGWNEPIGKTIQNVWGAGDDDRETLTIVGVVRDFHAESLHRIIEPVMITNKPVNLSSMSIRIKEGYLQETMSFIKETWSKFDPDRPFEYFFLDEFFDSQYKADERLSTLFSSFTLFAIWIACLGLFGLVSFTVERRTKEIGIRKVLGASSPKIVFLLSKDFVKLVLIANIIAWPAAYFIMRSWLQDFAYRTGFNPVIFILTAVLAFAIAVFTVSFQAIRAAIANPVKSLRYE